MGSNVPARNESTLKLYMKQTIYRSKQKFGFIKRVDQG